MSNQVKPIPEGMHSLTPHLVCRDANAAMDFYIQAFGATDEGRMPGPGGKLMHGMLRTGDSALMLVDENPDWGTSSPLSLNGSRSPCIYTWKTSTQRSPRRWRPARALPCPSKTCSGVTVTASSSIPSATSGRWPPISAT